MVAVGRVVRPWGLLGELAILPLAEAELLSPGRSVYLAGERRVIERAHWYRGRAYLKLSGIDSREQAEGYRSLYLEVAEQELQELGEGEYYYFQLIGLEVHTTAGVYLGQVVQVLPTGANDVLLVHGPLGEVLVPAVDEFITEVDLAGGRLLVEEVPGLLPEARRGD
jgi:16S rRNA processing protein RimM